MCFRHAWGRLSAAAVIAGACGSGAAHATENGATEYPQSPDTIYVGMVPPPGQGVLMNYTVFDSQTLHAGSQAIKGSTATAFVDVLRVAYTWPIAVDDNAITFSSDVIVGGGNLSVKIPTPRGDFSNGSTGLIDPAIFPLTVNYHTGGVFASATVAIWAPLGTYNKNAAPVQGLGLNHYTFGPTAFVTWMLGPKIQLDLASVTEFNTVNPHTHYTSGADETFSAGLSYAVTDRIQAGPAGYIYEQFTNDKQNGLVVNNGNRGQTLGIGAQAIYNIGHGGIVIKYFHDALVQNRAGGDQFWLQFAVPI
jgi:hypothetical protein